MPAAQGARSITPIVDVHFRVVASTGVGLGLDRYADLELLAFALLKEPSGWARLAHLEAAVWWTLILLAIFSLGLSMLLYFSVIQAVEVMRAALSI